MRSRSRAIGGGTNGSAKSCAWVCGSVAPASSAFVDAEVHVLRRVPACAAMRAAQRGGGGVELLERQARPATAPRAES